MGGPDGYDTATFIRAWEYVVKQADKAKTIYMSPQEEYYRILCRNLKRRTSQVSVVIEGIDEEF